MTALSRLTRPPRPQQGIALLVMVVFLLLSGLLFFLTATNLEGPHRERAKRSQEALDLAKQSLLAYAITYGDTHSTVPGYLPCPDAGNTTEGSYAGSCGSQNVSQLGKLPWKTLDMAPVRDGQGECLWLAVAGTFKNNPKTGLLNWDTPGLFDVYSPSASQQIAGPSPLDRAVAVIFAPGGAFGSQSHAASGSIPSCGGNYTAANYLDSEGNINNAVINPLAGGISSFLFATDSRLTPSDSDHFNDRLSYITAREVFDRIEHRKDFPTSIRNLLRYTAQCVAAYGNANGIQRLPWAAPVSLADYNNDASYSDQTGLLAGRLAFNLTSSNQIISGPIGMMHGYSGGILSNSLTSYCPSTPVPEQWRQNWKDQIFYAVADAYKPTTAANCSSGHCLSVNGTGQYAAVLLFSGRRLAALAQSRDTAGEKGATGNYLEDSNKTAVNLADGRGNFTSAAASATFNDIVMCIKPTGGTFSVDENCNP